MHQATNQIQAPAASVEAIHLESHIRMQPRESLAVSPNYKYCPDMISQLLGLVARQYRSDLKVSLKVVAKIRGDICGGVQAHGPTIDGGCSSAT